MQWFQGEKIKHRMIGLAVLLSIALVFVPAMVKKSNQRLDRNMNLSLKLPPKPDFPNVAAVKPQVLFKTIKVAQVVIPEVKNNHTQNVILARAESLSGQTMATRSIIQKPPVMTTAVAKVEKAAQRVAVTNQSKNSVKSEQRMLVSAKGAGIAKAINQRTVSQRKQTMAQLAPTITKSAVKSGVFAVQVASFSSQNNALFLVHSLQQKGFKATLDKQGSQYRVLVGELGQRHEAKNLQNKLTHTAQLTGFIVKVG